MATSRIRAFDAATQGKQGWDTDPQVQLVPAIGGPLDTWTARSASAIDFPEVPIGSYSLVLSTDSQRLRMHVVIDRPARIELGVLKPE